MSRERHAYRLVDEGWGVGGGGRGRERLPPRPRLGDIIKNSHAVRQKEGEEKEKAEARGRKPSWPGPGKQDPRNPLQPQF